MPTAEEVTTELSSRRKRAIEQFNRAQKSGTTRKSKTNRPEEDSETSQETETASESGADPLVGAPYFDAVNLGQGWRGYLMGIGFEGHIRMQLKAAVASYFYEQGFRGDRAILRAEIERAIEESPFLDSGEPWSRPRQDARDYLCAPSGDDSNIDEMISYIVGASVRCVRRSFREPTIVGIALAGILGLS